MIVPWHTSKLQYPCVERVNAFLLRDDGAEAAGGKPRDMAGEGHLVFGEAPSLEGLQEGMEVFAGWLCTLRGREGRHPCRDINVGCSPGVSWV